MVLFFCAFCAVCIIASVIFYKPYLGVVFVIISIPFEGKIDLGCILIYPLETILAVFGFIWIYKGVFGKYNYFGNTKLVYCCIPFVLCIMLSAMKSNGFSSTVKELVRWLELFLIYYITINLINDDKKMRVVLYSIFFTAAMVSALGISHYFSMGRRAISLFGNPNSLASYVNIIMPVLFGMLMICVSLWERIVLGISTVLLIVAWFLTFSRTGWISLILTMFLIFFLAKTKKRVAILITILSVVFAIAFLFSNMKDDLLKRSDLRWVQESVELRKMCYPMGFNFVKNDLIFGIGTGNYSLLSGELVSATSKHAGFQKLILDTNLHSLYLQILVVTGMMGVSAFVFWLVCIVKYLTRSLKVLASTRDYSLLVGLVGGVIVYLFNNLTEVLVVHGIHLQWGIILGLAVVLTQLRESETCPETA